MTKLITLGPNGSFSAYGTNIFAQKYFADFDLTLSDSFHGVWKSILTDPKIIGVLPIENSSTSNVHENIDFVFRHPELQILAEFFLPITLNLYGDKDLSIKDLDVIYSHPKAFEQCESFLNDFDGKIIEVKSTSDALRLFEAEAKNFDSESKKIGFIGGPQLEDMTTGNLLKKNIANQSHNVTRFLLITQSEKKSNSTLDLNKQNKATLIFETFHEKGALAKVLTLISHLDGNLLKIESRPIPHKPANYAFWIDIDLTDTPENLIDILRKNVQDLRVVGRYNAGKNCI
jgi:prephenate dehydratase